MFLSSPKTKHRRSKKSGNSGQKKQCEGVAANATTEIGMSNDNEQETTDTSRRQSGSSQGHSDAISESDTSDQSIQLQPEEVFHIPYLKMTLLERALTEPKLLHSPTKMILQWFLFCFITHTISSIIHLVGNDSDICNYLNFTVNSAVGVTALIGSVPVIIFPCLRRNIPMSCYNLTALGCICLSSAIYIAVSIAIAASHKAYDSNSTCKGLFTVRMILLGICFIFAVICGCMFFHIKRKTPEVNFSSYILLGSVLRAEQYFNRLFAGFSAPKEPKASRKCLAFYENSNIIKLLPAWNDQGNTRYWEMLGIMHSIPMALGMVKEIDPHQLTLMCPQLEMTYEELYLYLMSTKKELYIVFGLPFKETDEVLKERAKTMKGATKTVFSHKKSTNYVYLLCICYLFAFFNL